MKQFSQNNQAQHLGFIKNEQRKKSFVASSFEQFPYSKILLLLLAQVFLAILIRQNELVAKMYCLATIVVGLYWGLTKKNFVEIAFVIAYIAGAEVLWRMTQGAISYEIGKLSIIAILFVTLFKTRGLRFPFIAFLYFILLIPSSILTLQNESFSDAREFLSFYLSGPLAIFMCSWFFSTLNLKSKDIISILTAFLCPVIGVATLVLYGILTKANIEFTTESNWSTSGGFGPNQVSSILGLGALIAFFLLLINKKNNSFNYLMFCLLLVLGSLSAFTFSRGGGLLFVGSVSVFLIFLIISGKLKAQIPIILLFVTVGFTFILPALNDYSGGKLFERFQDDSTSNRFEFVETELDLWVDNPIFGIGVGQSRIFRENAAAHTEFTRLVSEHGMLGFIALLILLIAGMSNVLKSSGYSRSIKASLIAWTLAFMLVNALRLVAPAFALGLTFAYFLMDDDMSFERKDVGRG